MIDTITTEPFTAPVWCLRRLVATLAGCRGWFGGVWWRGNCERLA